MFHFGKIVDINVSLISIRRRDWRIPKIFSGPYGCAWLKASDRDLGWLIVRYRSHGSETVTILWGTGNCLYSCGEYEWVALVRRLCMECCGGMLEDRRRLSCWWARRIPRVRIFYYQDVRGGFPLFQTLGWKKEIEINQRVLDFEKKLWGVFSCLLCRSIADPGPLIGWVTSREIDRWKSQLK